MVMVGSGGGGGWSAHGEDEGWVNIHEQSRVGGDGAG